MVTLCKPRGRSTYRSRTWASNMAKIRPARRLSAARPIRHGDRQPERRAHLTLWGDYRRQVEVEPAALPGAVSTFNLPTELVDDAAHEKQPQAVTISLLRVQACKCNEELAALFGRESGTIVTDPEADLRTSRHRISEKIGSERDTGGSPPYLIVLLIKFVHTSSIHCAWPMAGGQVAGWLISALVLGHHRLKTFTCRSHDSRDVQGLGHDLLLAHACQKKESIHNARHLQTGALDDERVFLEQGIGVRACFLTGPQ